MLIEGARISREIFAQAPFAPYRGEEIFPGPTATTDADLETFVRRKAETIYHPVGTCRMGKDDGAVVDSELRVRGIEGLRVVDASVMPTLIGGNTNAPTIDDRRARREPVDVRLIAMRRRISFDARRVKSPFQIACSISGTSLNRSPTRP